jgi:predicted PurR-regulated permease PerM
MIFRASVPLIIGGVIAYFVNILMTIYEKILFPKSKNKILIKSRRPLCMIGAFVTILTIVSLIIGTVLPQFIMCLQLLLKELPSALSFLAVQADKLSLVPDNIADILMGIDWESKIDKIAQMLTTGVGNIMNVAVKAVSTVFSSIITGFLSVIFAVYLLLSKERLQAQFNRLVNFYIKKEWQTKIFYVLEVLNDCFRKYIVGQCTEAAILGMLCTVGMWILRFPYAAMIGALVGFTALIPIAGSYIGAVVGALMLLTVSPATSFAFLIYIVILQQLEGNIIYPKIVGNSIGLPGMWVLVAVTIGGGIMGVTGMLLGVPVAAAIYKIIRDDINGRGML